MPYLKAGHRHALVAALVVALTGCASPAEERSEETSESAFSKAKQGFNDLSAAWGKDKASGIAVVGSKAYVGLGAWGYAVHDLRTFDLLQKVERDEDGRLIPSETVQMVGDDLVLSGLRNDAPLDWWSGSHYNYVMSFVDPANGTVHKRVLIDVMSTITTQSPLFDIPTIAARIEGDKVWLVISHKLAKKVVSFDLPTGATTKLDLADLLEEETFDVGYAKDIVVEDGFVYVPEARSSKDGFVRKIDVATGDESELGVSLGYPVAVAMANGAVLVADHDGGLLAIDRVTGAKLATFSIPDWVTGVTVDANNVYVTTWKGVFVTKNAWN